MKDFISKLTFGFIMAQFVPGVISVCSIAFLNIAFKLKGNITITSTYTEAMKIWSSSEMLTKLFLVALCIGIGMLIHGIHWAILAHFQRESTEKDKEEEKKRTDIFNSFWHGYPIFLQIILGPIKILIEMLAFFFFGNKISDLASKENVPDINKDKMDAFNFIQDSYLHFAQFYAHTSYALLIMIGSLIIFIYSFGLSKIRIFLLITTYILAGVFFVIGRIQLATLCKAEREMSNIG